MAEIYTLGAGTAHAYAHPLRKLPRAHSAINS